MNERSQVAQILAALARLWSGKRALADRPRGGPADERDVIAEILKQGWLFKPPPLLKVSEWAERERKVSGESSPYPGSWKNARTPLLAQPMDALSVSDPTQELICKFSAQSGKTEILNNFIGYIIDLSPAPSMVIQPNQKPMAEAWSKERLAPMVRDTPALNEKVYASKGRGSENTILQKGFPGGILAIVGANSPAALASRPIRFIAADEIDRYEPTKEGDPLALAVKRTQAYEDRKKILKVSTPTIDGKGISREYDQAAVQWEAHLFCESCGEGQFPRFKHLKWDKNEDGHPENIRYQCGHCEHMHPASRQWSMKSAAAWVKVKGKLPAISQGFWMNQQASPLAEWTDTVREFYKAKDAPETLQAFLNTAQAETFAEQGEAPPEDEVKGLKVDTAAWTLPEFTQKITLGADVQDDRIYYVVRAWGVGSDSQLVAHGELFGNTELEATWDQLTEILDAPIDGRPIDKALIDSRHNQSTVYTYCKGKAPKVYPCRGLRKAAVPLSARKADVDINGKRKGVKVWRVDTQGFKDFIFARLALDVLDPGSYKLNREATDGYISSLLAEQRFEKDDGQHFYKATRHRNDYLDCEVYACAASHLAGVPGLRKAGSSSNSKPKILNTQDQFEI